MPRPLNVKSPPTAEQAVLLADIEREWRAFTALGMPGGEDRAFDIDRRRFIKISRREQDAIRVRIAALENQIISIESTRA